MNEAREVVVECLDVVIQRQPSTADTVRTRLATLDGFTTINHMAYETQEFVPGKRYRVVITPAEEMK